MLDEHELSELPEINPENVALHGKGFLKLIRLAQQGYENMIQPREDRPQDPNHENVIIVSSDEDEDFEDDNGSQAERSGYFQGPDPYVVRFNNQCE